MTELISLDKTYQKIREHLSHTEGKTGFEIGTPVIQLLHDLQTNAVLVAKEDAAKVCDRMAKEEKILKNKVPTFQYEHSMSCLMEAAAVIRKNK